MPKLNIIEYKYIYAISNNKKFDYQNILFEIYSGCNKLTKLFSKKIKILGEEEY